MTDERPFTGSVHYVRCNDYQKDKTPNAAAESRVTAFRPNVKNPDARQRQCAKEWARKTGRKFVRRSNERADMLSKVHTDEVRRHLSRGRSVTDIAILMHIPMSRVTEMMKNL